MNLPRRQCRLLVFAKAPQPGRVKTRLARSLGPVTAARVHQALLEHALGLLAHAPPCPVELWCAPDCRHTVFHACRQHLKLALHPQRGLDLGTRMHAAFAATLRHARAALLMGSDCPGLTPGRLRQALDALRHHDAVLIPARDGGYVLLGLRRPAPWLFSAMPWGTPAVLDLTRKRLRERDMRWAELAALRDVDETEDLLWLLREARHTPHLRSLGRRLQALLPDMDLPGRHLDRRKGSL